MIRTVTLPTIMDPIRCLCKKEARRVLIETNFIYYDCEDGDRGYEMLLCHCKKICQCVINQSKNNTQYFICSQKLCDFVIASCCDCNKICSVKISRTQSNPGLIFWSCKD